METMKIIKERVRKGANLLRTLDSKWYEKVNVNTIDLHSASDCLLGQVFGDYCIVANKLKNDGTLSIYGFDSDFCQHGFDYAFHHDKEDEIKIIEIWKNTILRIKSNENA